MFLLQLPHQTLLSPSSTSHRSGNLTRLLSHLSFSANGDSSCSHFRQLRIRKRGSLFRSVRIEAMADHALQKMNLNEYMVTLERPLGIRFALSADGKIFVHSMQRGGNAEKSRIIMVGDTIKLASSSSNGSFVEIKDLEDTQNMINEASGPCSLVLERPFTPFPLHELPLNADYNMLFNKGRVPLTTWNNKFVQTSYLKPSYDKNNNESLNLNGNGNGNGRMGYAIFSPQLLSPSGWAQLSGDRNGMMKSSKLKTEIIAKWAEEEGGETDWSYGGFPLEEYIKALDRAKDELCYNHARGMQYSKV